MKIVFMGTPPFAATLLEGLVEAGYEVECVFTQPDKPKGRGKKMLPPAVKEAALKLDIPVFQPKSLKDEEVETLLKKYQPDFLVVAAYGRILPDEVLAWPKIAPINIHASLLPKYRGAAPIQWAVRNGDKESGISIMKMEASLDAGPVYKMVTLALDENETTGSLFERLAVLSVETLPTALEEIAAGNLKAVAQNHAEATLAPMFRKEDEHIDWHLSAKTIRQLIQSLAPSPGAYMLMDDKRFKIYQAKVLQESGTFGEPGEIVEFNKKVMQIACGEGLIEISEIQPSGKKVMPIGQFKNGASLEKGDVFS